MQTLEEIIDRTGEVSAELHALGQQWPEDAIDKAARLVGELFLLPGRAEHVAMQNAASLIQQVDKAWCKNTADLDGAQGKVNVIRRKGNARLEAVCERHNLSGRTARFEDRATWPSCCARDTGLIELEKQHVAALETVQRLTDWRESMRAEHLKRFNLVPLADGADVVLALSRDGEYWRARVAGMIKGN